jgi:hypothetical protein
MCIVCTEWEKGKLTSKEALRNLGEMIGTGTEKEKEHFFKVSEKILDKEVPLADADEDLDQKWHEETHDE